MPEPLLAKSKSKPHVIPEPEMTLTGHTNCVLRAVDALFGRGGSSSPLARSWLQFFGLTAMDFGRFRHHLRVAAAAHDWGKADQGFQDAVAKVGERIVRHEHLSGLMLADLLADEAILDWVRGAGIDEVVLLAAVISHHVKVAPEPGNEHALGTFVGNGTAIRFRSDHPDFDEAWRVIQAEVGPPCPVNVRFPIRWNKDEFKRKREAGRKLLGREHTRLRGDRDRLRWVAAVRAGLIVADAVGSAVVRIDRDAEEEDAGAAIDRWIGECFARPLAGDEVWEEVITRRIADLRTRGRWDDAKGHTFGGIRGFKEFQCAVAGGGPRVLLTASCGSGKTLAAWNWIKAQLDARSSDRTLSRVLFLYPTRATATEGFRDYVSWAPEDDAGLLSGTAAYELDGMFETPDDSNDPRKGLKYRPDPRLYALGHWTKRIFSATADQFFPFMQYQYGPLCRLPLLVESVLVVDEVHSFDQSMFNTLRRFLGEFAEVPVLCMTASLSEQRRDDLLKCGLRPYTEEEVIPSGEVADMDLPRYRVEWIDRKGAEAVVRGALDDRERVLWVSNRVDDCRSVYQTFRGDDHELPEETTAFCYHSRFKLEDRKDRHKELIRAFRDAVKDRAEPRAVLGATTQVCEMSLDLDAEILVTDLAPIASLIQRMGRCNRDSKEMRDRRSIGSVYVLEPEPGKEKPYEKEELELARRFVDKLVGQDVSQSKLDRIYRDHDPGQVEPSKLCPFLDSGPYADGREDSFREIDEFAVDCILDLDETRVLAEIKAKRPIDGFVVPVPRYLTVERNPEKSRLPRWLRIAEMSRYCKLAGFDGRPRPAKGGQEP